MRQEIPLVLLVVVFTLAISLSEQGFAYTSSSHPFILEWGESGLTTAGHFSFPQNLAIDDSGNVYVTDLGNKRVQKFNNDGTFLNAWGSSGTGSGQFHAPAGITIFNNSVYVVDSQLDRVQEFDLNGNFVTKWGERGQDGGQFLLPNGIAVGTNGTIYVVDTGNHRIQKFTPDGEFISQISSSGTSNENLLHPMGIAVGNDESIYISEPGNNKIKKFDADGNFLKYFGPNVAGFEISPQGLVIDPNGNLYVADSGNDRIILLDDNDGLAITTWGSTGIMSGQFKIPKDITVDKSGYLFVTDSYGHRIQKFGSPINDQITYSQSTSSTTSSESTQESSVLLPSVNPVPGDLTKPNIVTPNDLLIEATGGLTPVSIGQAMATDESGIQSLTNNAPEKFPLGVTMIIWTAIDGAGNMGIATQTITVVDTIPPVIGQLPDVIIEAQSPSSNYITLENPPTNDVVGVLSITNDAPVVFTIGETLVTWSATDVAGNVGTSTQNVIVVDTTSPELYIPSDIVIEASSFDKNEIFVGEATVIDNGEIISITNDAPEFFGLGNTTISWIAADASGNTANKNQLVTVLDTTPPKMDAPPAVVFEATSQTSNLVELDVPNFTDIQNVTITNNALLVFPIGETDVTWLAVDGWGNNSTISQVVNVVDTTPPTVMIPEDVTVEATSLDNNEVVLGEVAAEDISGISSVMTNAPEIFSFGITNVTWTVTDNHNNSISLIQTVNVVDTTAPIINAPPDIEGEALNLESNFVDLAEPNVSDIIGIGNVTNDAPELFPLGMTTVTWTVKDTSGNSASDSQIVTLADTTSPIITPPTDLSVEATSSSGISIEIGEATATDLIGVPTINNNSPELFYPGETIVTWTATDPHGNVATANQTISVIDTTAPSIIPPADVTFEAENPLSNVIAIGVAEADDAVGIVSITNNAPRVFSLGDTLVTWTASDAAGNLATATQKISVVDTTPPSILSPEAVTSEATSALENGVDLGEPTVADAIGIESVTNDAPEFFPVGETIVTWTVVDTSSLSSSSTQSVTVVDTTPPTITVPELITVEATSENQNYVDFGTITTNDLVGISSVSNDAPEYFPLGLTTITWTATDESGNISTVQQKVSIIDTTSPALVVPGYIAIEAVSYDNNLVDLGHANATDAVNVISVQNNAPLSFVLGETLVTWTATDSSGNSVNATQLITIMDTTAPSVTAPEDVIVEATSLNNNTITLVSPNSIDSVSAVEITNDAPEYFSLGLTTITWTATDESGNIATAQQNVSVLDTTSPTLTVPEDVTIEATSSTENSVLIGEGIADDSVEIASVTNDSPEFFPYGETTVTWTATDTSGNAIQKIQTVRVVDTTAPSITPPRNVTVEATDIDGNPVDIGMASASDIMEITSISNDAPTGFSLGDTFVTWTATDEAGNSASAVQKITLVDTTSPDLVVPQDVTIDATSTLNSVTIGEASATDLIDVLPVVSNDAPEVFPLGITIVTWTSADTFGNSIEATQTVEVQACGKPVSYYNQIMGTPQEDILSGTNVSDLIFGFEGDDIISGAKGNDCIFGGEGDDVIFGDEGNDNISAGEGSDVIKGQSGDDLIEGGTGYDIIDGGDDIDTCNLQSDLENDLVVKCE